MDISDIINKLVPINTFNKGQAAKVLTKLEEEKCMIILKNSEPKAVLLSLDEYYRITGQELPTDSFATELKKPIENNATVPNPVDNSAFAIEDSLVEDLDIYALIEDVTDMQQN